VTLPDDPRVRALTVRPHPLTDYQQLAQEAPHERSDESDTDKLSGPHEQPPA